MTFQPPISAEAARLVATMTEAERADWDERAAIIEVDAGLVREAAELAAAQAVVRRRALMAREKGLSL